MVKPWDWESLSRLQQLDLMAWYEINVAEEQERQRQQQRDLEKAKRAQSKGRTGGRSRR